MTVDTVEKYLDFEDDGSELRDSHDQLFLKLSY